MHLILNNDICAYFRLQDCILDTYVIAKILISAIKILYYLIFPTFAFILLYILYLIYYNMSSNLNMSETFISFITATEIIVS